MGAELEFIKLGGDAKEMGEKKMEAKMDSVKDSMRACVKNKKETATSNVDDDAVESFQEACEGDAMKEFAKQGGKIEDFEEIKAEAARKEVGNKMETCVAAQLEKYTSLSSDNAKKDAYKAAANACDRQSEIAFLEAGGNKEEFQVEKMKSQRDQIANVFETCVANKKKADSNKKSKDATLECESSAKDAYLKAGGDESKYAREKKEAAMEKAMESVKACFEDSTKSTRDCEQKGEKAFKDLGLDEKGFSMKEQQERAVEDKMAKCISNNTKVKAEKLKSGFDPESDSAMNAYKEARGGCNKEAEDEFKKMGGDVKEFAKVKEAAKKDAVKDTMTTCMKEKIDAKKKADGKDADDADLKKFSGECDGVAKAKLLEAGGDASDYEEMKQVAAREQATNALDKCIND